MKSPQNLSFFAENAFVYTLHTTHAQRFNASFLLFLHRHTNYLILIDFDFHAFLAQPARCCNTKYVINYGFSIDYNDYIYRIGQTERAGKPGIAYTLSTYIFEDSRKVGFLNKVQKEAM